MINNDYPREKIPDRSLRDFYYILFRHKWKVILFFLAVVVTVTVGTFLAAATYRSEARLMVRIGRESVALDPTATTGKVISVGQSRESEINSELEILKSRELAEKVVDAIGPEFFLERLDGKMLGENTSFEGVRDALRKERKNARGLTDRLFQFLAEANVLTPVDYRERAVIQFMKNLAIETEKNSNILFLSYEAQSPVLAKRILNKLIGFYLDKHIVAHRTPGSYQFFDRESNQVRQELSQAEEKLKALKSKTGVASLDEYRKLLMTRIAGLKQEAESTQAALAISHAKARDLKQKLAGLSRTQITGETRSSSTQGTELMRSRLYELRLQEQELLSKYTENSIPVREVRRQIAEAQALLAKEEIPRMDVTTGVNPTYQEINLSLLKETATLSSLEAKARVVNGQLAAAQKEIKELSETEMQMVNLQRELELQDAKYRKYYENLEQARIDQALEIKKISNISLVQAATSPQTPVRPRKRLNLALGLFLGLFGGLGLAFFSEFLDHSIKTPQDVEERLGLQLLASIPYLKKK